ncbi:unnamed protein product [Natator depressus]
MGAHFPAFQVQREVNGAEMPLNRVRCVSPSLETLQKFLHARSVGLRLRGSKGWLGDVSHQSLQSAVCTGTTPGGVDSSVLPLESTIGCQCETGIAMAEPLPTEPCC